MGRIGWAEAHAAAKLNNIPHIYQYILTPIMNELFKYTWLYERYTCDAQPTHNNYFIEYPEMIVMILHEIIYGISFELNSITIAPHVAEFEYRIGQVHLKYSQNEIIIEGFPTMGNNSNASLRDIEIKKLVPNASYSLNNGIGKMNEKSDGNGTLLFKQVQVAQVVTITKT